MTSSPPVKAAREGDEDGIGTELTPEESYEGANDKAASQPQLTDVPWRSEAVAESSWRVEEDDELAWDRHEADGCSLHSGMVECGS